MPLTLARTAAIGRSSIGIRASEFVKQRIDASSRIFPGDPLADLDEHRTRTSLSANKSVLQVCQKIVSLRVAATRTRRCSDYVDLGADSWEVVRWIDRFAGGYAEGLKAHSALTVTRLDRKCICQESDWRQTRGASAANRPVRISLLRWFVSSTQSAFDRISQLLRQLLRPAKTAA